jgi:hypothetical protein
VELRFRQAGLLQSIAGGHQDIKVEQRANGDERSLVQKHYFVIGRQNDIPGETYSWAHHSLHVKIF